MSKYIPNSYQTPNIIVDELITKITDAEFKIYHVIIRNTTGWQRSRTDTLTVEKICNIVGKSKPTVIKALTGLIELKLIKRYGKQRTGYKYGVNFSIDGERTKTKKKLMVKNFYQLKYDQWLKTFTINGKELLPIMVNNFNHNILYILNKEFKHIYKHTCGCEQNKIKKNTKKENYETFIEDLKSKAPLKSKVTKTKEGKKLYKELKEKGLIEDLKEKYIKYQKENGNYSVRITPFMMDFESHHMNSTSSKHENIDTKQTLKEYLSSIDLSEWRCRIATIDNATNEKKFADYYMLTRPDHKASDWIEVYREWVKRGNYGELPDPKILDRGENYVVYDARGERVVLKDGKFYLLNNIGKRATYIYNHYSSTYGVEINRKVPNLNERSSINRRNREVKENVLKSDLQQKKKRDVRSLLDIAVKRI